MSQENVEVVRRSFDAYRRGDLEAALSDAHPEITWDPYDEAPMQGLDAVRGQLARWESDWGGLETTPVEFIDAGDRVVVVAHYRGKVGGAGSTLMPAPTWSTRFARES